jgi:hypothetical protein
MSPRRRHQPSSARTVAQAADLPAGETFRPTMTGAFARYRAPDGGATLVTTLPDALSFVYDEDTEAPRAGLL